MDQRKVAFYVCVSTERQAKVEEGSLNNQEQMLRAELGRRNVQHKDWGCFVESYVDEGISAKTTNRPAFQRLMRDIELERIDTVMFKGRLLIDQTEAEVVRAIFQTYTREKSIRRTTDRIKERFEGKSPRLKRITPGKIYSALTNRAYIGIRQINKRSKEGPEEVPAAWLPIVTEHLFQKAQMILKASTDRYHRRGPHQHVYLLSRLLACGKCGQRLQGKSAHSSSGKRHRYYSHRSTCPEGGLARIDAEMAQELVLEWLRDVASNGEKFRELEAQGRERIAKRIGELRKEVGKLGAELTGVGRQIEARIQELTRAKSELVRESIEKSIVALEEERKDTAGRQALIDHSVTDLEGLVSKDKSLFSEYRGRIQQVLKKPEDEKKPALAGLIASLLLQDGGIKIGSSENSGDLLKQR